MPSPWTSNARRVVGLIVRRPEAIRRDADDELASVLDERVADLIAKGMSPEAARDQAVQQMGGSVDDARNRVRQSAALRERALSFREWIGDAVADARYAARGLIHEPLFSVFAVLTLALGIGANAAMFGIADTLLLRGPAHVREPARVVRLYWNVRQPAGELRTTAAFDKRVYANLLAESRAFSSLAMYTGSYRGTLLGTGPAAHLVWSAAATANFMSVLGTRPVLGRFFAPDEQESDSPPAVAVLGYNLWQSEFGGDRAIVGRTVTISARPYTVVGIAPEGFTGAELSRVDVWYPLSVQTGPAARHWGRGHSSGPAIVGRLGPAVTLAQASRDATLAYRRTYDGGERDYAEASLTAAPLHYGPNATESTEANIARWLTAISAIVLLVACANIVNLLLARAARRRRELAVRMALGAGRVRLLRLLLANSLLLALLGAAAGLLVAFVSGTLVRRVLLPDVDWTSGAVNEHVLAFSVAVALVTGLVIGILPALRAGRTDVTTALKSGAREGGGNRSVVRTTLMAAQAALAMVLLVGAGLFVRSLERVRHLDLGLDADRVVVVRPRWPALPPQTTQDERAREQQRREHFAREVLDRLGPSPIIEHAAAAVGMPFGIAYSVTLALPGHDSLPRLTGSFGDPDVSAVSADYFATVGTRLLAGRLFTAADRPGSEPVAIVSETMARALWPNSNPLGQYMLVGGGRSSMRTRVVGVVQDVRRSRIREDPVMHYYLPLGQLPTLTYPELVVRPRGDASAVLPGIRGVLRQIDPTIAFVIATTLQEQIDPQMRSWRVGAMMFSLFAAIALVVAAAGTFSIVAYLVEQRRHEIGVRIALGAQVNQVVGLMLRGAVGVTAFGAALGGLVALAAGKIAEPLLFETNARDPAVFAIVGSTLLAAALLASTIAAMRARKVDPIEALRAE